MKIKKVDEKISGPAARRLPVYYRCLSSLMQLGIRRISSSDLGNMMGITSSQVRQDFSSFGGNGLQGYGYDVEFLHGEIRAILGLDTQQPMIIIGAGSLGQALAKHTSFEKRGFKLVGIFDVSPLVIGARIRDIEVMHLDQLEAFLRDHQVDIAAITVPDAYANEVAATVINLGIKGLWNFAAVEMKVPQDVIVENIHLCDNLIVLGYKLSKSKRSGGQPERLD